MPPAGWPNTTPARPTARPPAPGSGPAPGSLTLHGDGSFLYTPASGYYGTDGFTYSASVPGWPAAQASVTLDVAETAPSLEPDLYTVAHGKTLSLTASLGVLSNDSDAE